MKIIKYKLFIRLLKWFCNEQLDQWENMHIDTKYGPVYVSISRHCGYPDTYIKV